jgi:hypothetical protein
VGDANGHEAERSGLERSQRERIVAEFNALMPAFDVALSMPTQAALDRLRRDTDRLMRTLAGVRLALERITPL